MENSAPARTSPKDFFLWLGVIIALYGSVSAVIALKFAYIDYLFPDALAGYADPYGGPMRLAMAALIVLVPTLVILLYLIRDSIVKEPAKADIWVRRWALGLTLFIAALTILIDLVTLINTYLGGEITVRFGLKVAAVLGVALAVFLHTYYDRKGFWIRHGNYARIEAIVVIAGMIIGVIAGFLIIGSPAHIRDLRLDGQRVSDLSQIQSQVVYYYQQKRALPRTLTDLSDPLSGFTVPVDPQTNAPYRYETTGPLSFELCAIFHAVSADTKGRGPSYGPNVSYPVPAGLGGDENWQHAVGETCFTRTIDPQKFPPTPAVKPL